jgi:hypothetical protein
MKCCFMSIKNGDWHISGIHTDERCMIERRVGVVDGRSSGC